MFPFLIFLGAVGAYVWWSRRGLSGSEKPAALTDGTFGYPPPMPAGPKGFKQGTEYAISFVVARGVEPTPIALGMAAVLDSDIIQPIHKTGRTYHVSIASSGLLGDEWAFTFAPRQNFDDEIPIRDDQYLEKLGEIARQANLVLQGKPLGEKERPEFLVTSILENVPHFKPGDLT